MTERTGAEILAVDESFLAECAALFTETFNAEPWNDGWELSSAAQRLADILRSPGFAGVLARIEGRVAGAVFGNIERWYDGNMYHLREMFVSRAHQSAGLGGSLLRALEEILRQKDVHTLYLFTARGGAAEKFYTAAGLSPVEWMTMMSVRP